MGNFIFRADEDVHVRLKAAARENGVSANRLLNRICEWYLGRDKTILLERRLEELESRVAGLESGGVSVPPPAASPSTRPVVTTVIPAGSGSQPVSAFTW